MQKPVIVGIMLGTMAIMWWAALVFYYEGEYYSLPRVSMYLVVGAAVSLAVSLRNTGDKDKAERWYLKKGEL